MRQERDLSKAHARFNVTFYDGMWNELESMRIVRCTASEMVDAVEMWNRLCQRVSRDPAIIITPIEYAAAIGVEVIHV